MSAEHEQVAAEVAAELGEEVAAELGGTTVNHAFLHKLRWMGFIEGVSTLVLFFIAMPLKYLAGRPIAVEIAGSIHGGLFVCLVLMLAIAVWRIPIKFGMALMGMFSAVVPFGPFVYDRWLREVGVAAKV